MVDVDDDNPFRLPPDDQIFLIREQERQKRAEDRERVKQLRVWQKTTASSRVQKNRRVDDGADETVLAAETAKQGRGSRTESLGRDPRREKENVSDFVAKKREMFLVQMSLDVKKAEILKLDEKAKQKEEALKASEKMLDADVARFDQFLQNNDQKAHKAMKDAEEQTKTKQDKLTRIKQLKSQLSAIQSDIAKHREQREECLKFKAFLEKLTPLEWKDEKTEEKMVRKRARRTRYVQQQMAEISAQMHAEMEAEERAYDERTQEAAKGGRRRQRREAEEEAKERERALEQLRRKIRRKYKTTDAVEAEFEDVSSGEEMPLFFEEPQQLMEVFTSLEEKNLFLIQTSQDTEQMLEEIEQRLEDKKRTMGAQTSKLEQNIQMLQAQIKEEQEKCEELRQQVSQKHGKSEQDQLLAELADRVLEVHVACGHDTDADPDTLQMLSGIEATLEQHLTTLDEAEDTGHKALVTQLQKEAENRRRQRMRAERKEQTLQKIEMRLKQSLERSQAPMHKKVGKQIMFRSPPLFQARRVVQEDNGYEEALREHEVFGIWINKEGIPSAKPPERPT